ncbi:MAG: hypothetical protein IMF08_07070 [Proteobacteria bacterium]|nr:hypothetical protein [Pseudomonadota bacterium]MCK4866824.1 hypothetical protein [Alphaproteobacteria bacterium]
MTCNSFYDFISGARIQLPTVSRAIAAVEEDGRHGVRAILTPSEEAQALIRDQVRMLSELSCTKSHR